MRIALQFLLLLLGKYIPKFYSLKVWLTLASTYTPTSSLEPPIFNIATIRMVQHVLFIFSADGQKVNVSGFDNLVTPLLANQQLYQKLKDTLSLHSCCRTWLKNLIFKNYTKVVMGWCFECASIYLHLSIQHDGVALMLELRVDFHVSLLGFVLGLWMRAKKSY